MHNLSVLLCDDSLLVRKKMRDALARHGFTRLHEASDGEEAVRFCETEAPDVVLLDIVMPKKNGIEALQEIKRINADVHVVIASSVGTQSHLIQALKLGADNFLQKPVDVEALLAIFRRIADKRGER